MIWSPRHSSLLTKSPEELHPQGREDEEEEEEEEAEVTNLGQGLHNSVQQGPDSFRHLEELKDSGDSEYPHHSHDGGVDREDDSFNLLESYPE